MSELESMVFVVDDDAAVREAVKKLLSAKGMRVETFASPREFLEAASPDVASCLVLDVRMPELNGLDFQRNLTAANIPIPIVFITGHGDIPMTVRAMKAGAVQFLTKPFRGQDLIEAIQEGLARDRLARRERAELAQLRARYNTLTAREREVLALVLTGMLNKQIAADLGASESTIKTHRGHIMQKMEVDSVAELVKVSERLKLSDRSDLH
jgi:FixJ family two-component response regulator